LILLRRSVSLLSLFMLLLWQLPLSAATVQALVSPAWVEKNGARQPLQAGQELTSKDTIETALGGKVRLLLETGVVLKLGADSRVRLGDHQLTLLKGLLRLKMKRQVGQQRSYRLYSHDRPTLELSAGELWLNSSVNRWRACRVKGSVVVEVSPKKALLLSRPRSCFEWLSGEAQGEQRRLTKSRFKRRLQMVNIVKDEGILTPSGRWVAYFGQFQRKGGEGLLFRLRQQGFPAESEMAYFSGEESQRIMVRGFYEELEALAFIRRYRSWSDKRKWVEEQ